MGCNCQCLICIPSENATKDFCTSNPLDEAAVLLRRPDGTLTGNVQEADDLLRAAWLPIFQSYGDEQPPSWELFLERFGDCITEGASMHLESLSGEMLARTLAKMANKSAPGADGWRV